MAATEPPSARRLREAREQGRVPRSEVLAPSALLLACCGLVAARGAALWASAEAWLTAQLERAGRGATVAPSSVLGPAGDLALVVAAAFAVVVLVQRAQVGFVWATRAPAGAARPLLHGWLSGLLLSILVLAAAAGALERAVQVDWLAPSVGDGASVGGALRAFALVFALGAVLVAAIDVARSREAHLRSLRMERHEVERERRDTEGPREPRRRQRRLFQGGGRRP